MQYDLRIEDFMDAVDFETPHGFYQDHERFFRIDDDRPLWDTISFEQDA